MNDAKPRKQVWVATRHQNLFKLGGTYYGRIKVDGKTIRKSFQTGELATARDRLVEWQRGLKTPKAPTSGTFGGIIEIYLAWLSGRMVKQMISQRTFDYKTEQLAAIRSTWPGFDKFELGKLTRGQLEKWLLAHRTKYSATRTNGAVTVIRELIGRAVTLGTLPEDSADSALKGLEFTKVKYDYKRLTLSLPEPAQLLELRNEIYRRCQVSGSLGGWLFDFLLFSGCRIESAQNVHWEDVRWTANSHGKLYFRRAKYGPYEIPLFPQLRELLERIKLAKPGAQPSEKILPTQSLQTILRSACQHLKLTHLSHHDLRHIFATRCIESGRDIPTVASWMGHKDGGRTAMMVYGHLRQTHSNEQAALMDFLPAPKV